MATNIVQPKRNHSEEKQDHKEDEEEQQQQQQHEDEEEEEALSLCDLPINLNDQPRNQEHQLHHSNEEEFNFRSWGAGAPFSKEPQMCAADEVFFKGQILPLRVSFSSEAGLLATLSQSQKHYGNSNSSESLDCNSSDFKNSSNNSSRSSSLRSQNSSTSTSSTSTFKYATIPKIQNQFHAHPSPKPQLRSSVPTHSQSRKSTSAWGIFRLGVVPAPEIGLQDLKVRNKNCGVVSRNSSSSSSNSVKSVITSNNKNRNNHKSSNHNVLKQLVGKGGGLLSGCDCSFETVQPKNMVMIKGDGGGSNSAGAKSRNMTESTTHAAKEKVVGELKNKQKKKQQKQGKKVTSRRRTFEWIKELHATQPEDEQEALLSNSS